MDATLWNVRVDPNPKARYVRRRWGSRAAGASFLVLLAACSGDGGSVAGPAVPTGGGSLPGPTGGTPNVGVNPFAGARFYVEANSNARRTADSWRATRPADADQMEKIANRSNASWFAEWSGDIYTAVRGAANAAASQNAMPVLVAYNIPDRDCGGLSGGGGATASAYRTWIAAFANALAGRKAAVILEPDALSNMDCLSAAGQAERISLLKYAVQTFKAAGPIAVYIDAGHAAWHPAHEAARRLKLVGVEQADGFSLNVSNFIATSTSTAYGKAVSAMIGGKHFVIDTSRNGLGGTPDNQWCNPEGRALGHGTTGATGDALVDAYIWIKAPGESDGACNGAPAAGVWWPEYALGLAQRAP